MYRRARAWLNCSAVFYNIFICFHVSEAKPLCSGGGHSVVKKRGGWLDSLGSGILVGKGYFGVLQKYVIRTIIKG